MSVSQSVTYATNKMQVEQLNTKDTSLVIENHEFKN